MKKCEHCNTNIETGWYVCPDCGNHQNEKTNNERTNKNPDWFKGASDDTAKSD
jgi:predicted RNA-binding Zn-ribbon protein involved in translation (DUF1610 family)